MNEYLKFMSDIARRAGKIQMGRFGCHHRVEYKGVINLVTDVDRECEALIVGAIQKEYPKDDVLAEEGSGHRSSSGNRWIVDPLDGTVNYAHGFPFFCISIALERNGRLEAGVIYDPNRDELFAAGLGQGASMNGERISVSESEPLRRSLLATGFAYNVQEEQQEDNLDHFVDFIKTAQALRRPGSAAIDLAWIACGRIDGFWELFLKPWDMAAGVVIVREAGGMVTSFDGGEYDLYGTEILASNRRIHREMVDVLKKT